MQLVTIRINNRINKILNFSNKKWSSNNTYIIRGNTIDGTYELFSIKQDAVLIEGKKQYKTIRVNDIHIEGNIVTVSLEKGRGKAKENPLVFDSERGEYIYNMSKPEESDCIQVTFNLEGSNNSFSVFMYFAPSAETVYDAIVDFGSEASQACWYQDENRKDVNITQGIHEDTLAPDSSAQTSTIAAHQSQSTSAPKDDVVPTEQSHCQSEKKQVDITDYVQYETDTLYKSIYYMKKDLGETALKPWPNYKSDEIRFLVSNREEVDQRRINYFQLPNAKLSYFDISGYNNMTLRYRGNQIKLWQLPGDRIIERVLLNNIVLQTLRSIKIDADLGRNDAYVVLNVLMPNVYPIHVISEKLNQLAEDINTLLKDDAFKRIKAVELHSVSESDASLLGYAASIGSNKQRLDEGNYLIMDAGKGTLDFSLMEVCGNDGYVSKSRAGIIGAGNAITYGLIIGLVNDYLSEVKEDYPENPEEQADQIRQFIYDKVLEGNIDVAKLQKFHNAVEAYKKVYNDMYKPPVDGTTTDTEMESVASSSANGTLDESKTEPGFETTGKGATGSNLVDLDNFNKWVESLCNSKKNLSEASRKYVTIEIENIAAEAIEKMGGIFNCIQKLKKEENEEPAVDCVVFTGRGFLMIEFQNVMLDYLKKAKIVKQDAVAIIPKPDHMKTDCLKINIKLNGGKYDASPSRQSVGLLSNIDGNKDKKQKKTGSGREKSKFEERPDRPNEFGLHGFSTVSGRRVRELDGDIERDGINIEKNLITADSSLSIGGWFYDIHKDFSKKPSKVFFDGIHYWITADNKAQELGRGTVQQCTDYPLCFESLFPNVSIKKRNEIKIPKERTEYVAFRPLFLVDDKVEQNEEQETEQQSGIVQRLWKEIKEFNSDLFQTIDKNQK